MGIILKNDSIWCEAKQNIDAILGQKCPPVCHHVAHHQERTTNSDPEHYTNIARKRTIKIFTDDSNKRRRGILRNIPSWEINKQERLGVVLHGDTNGIYQVRPCTEMTYSREEMMESTRAENGDGGYAYARDMKL